MPASLTNKDNRQLVDALSAAAPTLGSKTGAPSTRIAELWRALSEQGTWFEYDTRDPLFWHSNACVGKTFRGELCNAFCRLGRAALQHQEEDD